MIAYKVVRIYALDKMYPLTISEFEYTFGVTLHSFDLFGVKAPFFCYRDLEDAQDLADSYMPLYSAKRNFRVIRCKIEDIDNRKYRRDITGEKVDRYVFWTMYDSIAEDPKSIIKEKITRDVVLCNTITPLEFI